MIGARFRLRAAAPTILPGNPHGVIAGICARINAFTAAKADGVLLINGVGERAAKAPVFLCAANGCAINIGLTAREIGRISRDPGSVGKVIDSMCFP